MMLQIWAAGAMEQKKGQEEFKDCGTGCLFLMVLHSLKKDNSEQKFLES